MNLDNSPKKIDMKRNIQLTIIAVLILTLISIGVSYSAFFNVGTQTTIQTLTTGTLEVVIDSTSSPMSGEDLMPTAASDLPTAVNSVVEGDYASINLTNSGTLDADFSVALTYDELPEGVTEEDLLPLNYLSIGIFNVTANSWMNFGTSSAPVYHTPITGLTPSETNVYPILRNTIGAGSTIQARVYIWLSEDTPITEIGKLVYLKLDIKSTTVEES